MIKTLNIILFLFITALVTGCESNSSNNSTSTVKQTNRNADLAQRLEAHMGFLASDELMGRDTGTREYDIAANYVASQYQLLGLKPGGDGNSWFQEVTLIESELLSDSVAFSIDSGEQRVELAFIEDYLVSPNPLSEQDQVSAQVVFVGYGIDSEAMDHNDYENLDVSNKIVMMLRGRPAHFPSEEGAYLGSTSTKYKTAAAKGAIGAIVVHTPAMEQRVPFERYRGWYKDPSYHWMGKDGSIDGGYKEIKSTAYITTEAAKRLFSAAGDNFEPILQAMESNQIPQGSELDIQVTLKRASTHKQLTSPNVIGVIPGTDPLLKNEYVVYSAHLDHVGPEEEGEDIINNGALDNASGTAILIETARQLMLQAPSKRSILFIALTAEEKGLLGSSYFANHPTVPIQSMVANINLDMPLILYPFGDLVAFGSDHSTLAKTVTKAVKNHNLKLSPDPIPEQAIFVRSDHFSFVEQGIPSIYLMPGYESQDPEIDGKAVFNEFLKEHYHQVSDEITLPIDYQAGAVFTLINTEIGAEIANSKAKPRWNEGDYFGDLFSKPRDEIKLNIPQQ